jgi:hypothetical protein
MTPSLRPNVARAALGLALLVLGGCATRRITGRVVDRNGAPVAGAIVAIDPGGVEVVTDGQGAWSIDYLRDAAGERVRLAARTTYAIEVFRVGYHIVSSQFAYRSGEVAVETVTLVEDSIRVAPPEDDLDPARYERRPQASGAAYEGE